MKRIKSICINNHDLISCDYPAAGEIISNFLSISNPKIFIHANLNNYYILHKVKPLQDYPLQHCLMFFEGIGMKIGAFIIGHGWNEDISGTDLYPLLFKKLSEQAKSVFFLGAEDKVIKKAVSKVKKDYPSLKITGFKHGFFKENEEVEIVRQINSTHPDLLIIGMGMVKEIDFINKHYSYLNGASIWCVGGLFDFLSGRIQRAPAFIRQIRMEWLFRFILQPVEKFTRTFITPFWFIFHIIGTSIKPELINNPDTPESVLVNNLSDRLQNQKQKILS